MPQTDTQILPELTRAETSKQVSAINKPAHSTAQQLSRFATQQNKTAQQPLLTQPRAAMTNAVLNLRAHWAAHSLKTAMASNLIANQASVDTPHPCDHTTPDQGDVAEMDKSSQAAMVSASQLEQNAHDTQAEGSQSQWFTTPAQRLDRPELYYSKDEIMGKQGSWGNRLTRLYARTGTGPRCPIKRAAMPIGNVAPQASSPTGPIQQPPQSGDQPPGAQAQAAGLPVGSAFAAQGQPGVPSAGPQPGAAAPPPGAPPGGQPAAPGAPPPNMSQMQPGQQTMQPPPGIDPQQMANPQPPPPSPLPRGKHLDEITPDNKSHPLNRLMDDAQDSEEDTTPNDHEEGAEDESSIGGQYHSKEGSDLLMRRLYHLWRSRA